MTEFKIAVFGASGYTGTLVVAELARRGLPAVLVGRDRSRLRRAARTAGRHDADLRLATVDSPDALAAAFADVAVVINTAGPFAALGEPVVHAAVAVGAHYVDTTGEQAYLKHIFDTWSAPAEDAGVSIVPGLADDGGPGDLIAHLTADRVAPVHTLTIADLRTLSGASRGTARSMLGFRPDAALTYVDGRWVTGTAAGHPPVAVPGVAEPVAVTGFALPGVVTIPRHTGAQRVTSVLRAEVADAFGGVTPDLVEAMPEGPTADERRGSRWTMVAQATGTDGRRAVGVVAGTDGYHSTAVIAVEGARRLGTGTAKPGVLAPAEAFDAAGFLDYLAPFGVTWSVQS